MNLYRRLLILSLALSGCQFFGHKSVKDEGLVLPFIKEEPSECYYLDDFMPVPNNMVSGKAMAMNVRYYTYEDAYYKDWPKRRVTLGFYSQDQKCWTLYEEYYLDE